MTNEKILGKYSADDDTDSLVRFPSYSRAHAIAIFGEKKWKSKLFSCFYFKIFSLTISPVWYIIPGFTLHLKEVVSRNYTMSDSTFYCILNFRRFFFKLLVNMMLSLHCWEETWKCCRIYYTSIPCILCMYISINFKLQDAAIIIYFVKLVVFFYHSVSRLFTPSKLTRELLKYTERNNNSIVQL